jgi:hypothetical protein
MERQVADLRFLQAEFEALEKIAEYEVSETSWCKGSSTYLPHSCPRQKSKLSRTTWETRGMRKLAHPGKGRRREELAESRLELSAAGDVFEAATSSHGPTSPPSFLRPRTTSRNFTTNYESHGSALWIQPLSYVSNRYHLHAPLVHTFDWRKHRFKFSAHHSITALSARASSR